MKKLKIMMTGLFISMFFIGFNPRISQAADMNFSFHANLPENQQDKQVTYFDLLMKPEQKQTITITVKNSANKEETLLATVNNAQTNQNGVIDYTQHAKKKDPSLKIGIEDIVKNNKQEIHLAPNEQKEVAFQLDMPVKPIKGTILGGIHLAKKEQKQEQKNNNVMIKNQYSYVIGLMVREKTTNVAPRLQLRSVQPELMNYRQVVTAHLQNDQPTILRNLKVKATITKAGEKKSYKTAERSEMNMAPNSSFRFPIPWEETIKPGKYTLHLKAEAEQGKYTWTFSKKFTIKDKKVNQLNKEAIHEEKESFPVWGYLLIGFSLFLLIVIIYLVYRLKKKQHS